MNLTSTEQARLDHLDRERADLRLALSQNAKERTKLQTLARVRKLRSVQS
jgi:hypothetical protein